MVVKRVVAQFFLALAWVFFLGWSRVHIHQAIRKTFLPGFFKWGDVASVMYSLYFGVAVVVVTCGLLVLRKFKTSKWSVAATLFGFWLVFPTYKKWDVTWLDYMGSPEEEVRIVAPILLSVEHFVLIDVDTLFLLASTCVFLYIVRIIQKKTMFGNTLSFFSWREIAPFFFSVLVLFVCLYISTYYLILYGIYVHL
ncbi:hypothetical protein SCOR_03305 [Sulfidibacter corallicola]|uniref:Uncharacterized protein n=1 Tax=Sulfidibacter corallicola TaxID=2818388 RepID=A0A8A4TGZ0_SULCO|nr:hypothetical protein [Sulfidibacter corallicola]QTD48442.1 hypothetical protein J3U87_22920 [Sulfidibacter corallicola]